MLMLSVLGVLLDRKGAQQPAGDRHEVLMEVMKSMVMGLKMAEGVAIGAEVTMVRATILRRWDWYGPTPRVTPAWAHQVELPRMAQAEALRDVTNCTAMADKTGEPNAREGIAFGLQIMGVFTLCGLLATLGWGGLVMVISKAWSVEEVKKLRDVSTSTGSLDRHNRAQLPKPVVISPQEERARWEWPRRTVSATRRVQWMGGPTSGATCRQEQVGHVLEMSTCGRPSGGSVIGHNGPKAADLP